MEIYDKINISNWNEAEIQNKLDLLPIFFKNKILKYSTLIKKQQRIQALELLQIAFSEQKLEQNIFNLDAIQYSEKGKPFINNQVDFSFAYSENIVLVGLIHKGKIGVDVEKCKPINLIDYKDFFTKLEWKNIMNADNKDKLFYHFWTRKEAVTKALGEGMLMDFNSFEVIESEIKIHNETLYLSTEWNLDYCISVVINKNASN